MYDEYESFLFDDEDNFSIYEIENDEDGFDELQDLIDEEDNEGVLYYDEDDNEYFDKDLKYSTELYVIDRIGYNPKTGEKINVYRTIEQMKKKERYLDAPTEKFIWLRYQDNKPLLEDYNLNSADICRFIFASVHRNNNGEIFTNNHIRIDYSNFDILMKLPKTTYHRFLKTIKKCGGLREWFKDLYYLKKEFNKDWKGLHRKSKYNSAEEKAFYESEEGKALLHDGIKEAEQELIQKYIEDYQTIKNKKAKVIIDKKYINRGKLSAMYLGDDWKYIRLYKEPYRQLYLDGKASHTIIGNLFKLIPYMNTDDNSINILDALNVLDIKKNNKHQFLNDMAKIKYVSIEDGTLYISKELISNTKLDDIIADAEDNENEAY